MSRFSRRTFVMGSAATLVASRVARASGQEKSDRLRLGVIGTAGRGGENLKGVAGEEIVALCDVDLARTARAAQQFPGAIVVQDFRRVLDRKDVDAVVVSTPDHWHALITVWALQAGKHVYCEKPLARSIGEARAMVAAAKRHKLVTQMGTQIHAGDNYRRVVELVQAGAIGPVRRVDVWCEKAPDPGRRLTTGAAVPSTLDYEMWVGPAAWRPYDPAVLPFNWRWWWDFGGGVLADMACHYMDLPHWALGLRTPEVVNATGTQFIDADNTVPVEMRVDFYYPARGSQPPVHLTWRHGVPGPRGEDGQVMNLGYRSGVLFHGDRGQLLADYGRHALLPEEQYRDYRRPEPSIPASIGHHQEWIQAIKQGGTPTCQFEYGGALTETVLLGNLSYRTNHEIRWDHERGVATNVRGAEQFIYPEYRGNWKLHG